MSESRADEPRERRKGWLKNGNPPGDFAKAPRCRAMSKRTKQPCRAAAMANGVCYHHGGKSTGPKTPEGLERSRKANWKHGEYSAEAKVERAEVEGLLKDMRGLLEKLGRP